MNGDRVDVLVVGAGLSGIAAGYYLQSRLGSKSYLILEAREALGGTWDLFRYPGIRSDSDMHTLGYSFYPWGGDVSLAAGPAIKNYVERTAQAFKIDRNIRFGERVVRASWSSADAAWTVDVDRGGTSVRYTCSFLYFCSGYYEYERGYQPQWEGMETYRGTFVHPQAWPADLDLHDRNVLVIGSGATAVTLVPAIARTARHVTMLQRSPSYVVSLPAHDPLARALYRLLPARAAHATVRWKNIALQMLIYAWMRAFPHQAKGAIKKMARRAVGSQIDVERHFSPSYNPWDQRLCLVPDDDLFEALRDGRASIVTDAIERFTETGVRLRSGAVLDADVVVSATGLNVRLFGGVKIDIDGVPLRLGDSTAYKGMMLCGVPNLAMALGYTNASWTLKCELTARYVCRLIAYMDRHGYRTCVPHEPRAGVDREPAIGLRSGYIRRALNDLPKQGTRTPWRLHQNYALDLASLRFGPVDDGVMEFAR